MGRRDSTRADEALQRVFAPAPPAPPTPGGETVVQVPFDFSSPSPMVLQVVTPGQVLNRATIAILVPFDDGAAQLRLGTTSVPGGVLDLDGSVVPYVCQATTEDLFAFIVPDFLQLVILPGASTQGRGLLLYKVK